MNEKNVSIEILRFLLTISICLHHFRMYSNEMPYGGGYIAVDFFFIISGFFLARRLKDINNQQGMEIGRYIKKRFIRLFPNYFLAFVIALLVRLIVESDKLHYRYIGGYLREAFMIEIMCLDSKDRINPPDWYCGYLLMGTIIVCVLSVSLLKKSSFYWYGILAVGIYFIFAIWNTGCNIYPQTATVISVAIFRAVAGLMLGCFIYYLIKKHGINNCEKKKRPIIFILIIGLMFLIFYVLLWDNSIPYIDYIAIGLFCILFLLISIYRLSIRKQHMQKILLWFGKISYILYLNHYIVSYIFNKYRLLSGYDWKAVSVIYLLVVFSFSVIVYVIEQLFEKGTMMIFSKRKCC